MALLLDFDGVMVRNTKVQKHVSQSCVRLLANKSGLTLRQASRMNKQLYPLYGHSSFILQRNYKIDCGIEEFNHLVYNEYIDYAKVKRLLTSDDTAYAAEMARIIHRWGPEKTFIFSNAVDVWCENLLLMMGVSDVIPPQNIMCSNHLRALKPSPSAYAEAEFRVGLIMPELVSGCYTFVDDHAQNILAVKHRPRWIPYYYPPEMETRTLGDLLFGADT